MLEGKLPSEQRRINEVAGQEFLRKKRDAADAIRRLLENENSYKNEALKEADERQAYFALKKTQQIKDAE